MNLPLTLAEWGILASLIAAFLAIYGFIASRIPSWIKPTIIVKLEDGQEYYEPNTEVTLRFLFENVGKFYFLKPTAEGLVIMMYFPDQFIICEAERQDERTVRTFRSTSQGIFAKTHYILVPDPFNRVPPIMSSLRYGEIEKCSVKVKTPNAAGDYQIQFDMSSRVGDLRIEKVILKIRNP